MTDFAKVDCTAIPDGVYLRNRQPMLRLSVVLRPEPTSEEAAVPLLEWPNAIPKLQFAVQFGPDIQNLVPLSPSPQPEFESAGSEPGISVAATRWWKDELWANPAALSGYIELMRAQAGSDPTKVEFSSYSFLADMARSRVESDIEISILAAQHRRNPQLLDKSNLSPIAVARLENPDDPTVRVADAMMLINRQTFWDLPIGDAIGSVIARTTPGGARTGLGAGIMTDALTKKLQDRYTESRDTILGQTAPASAANRGLPSEGEWNPFTAKQRTSTRAASYLLEDRYDDLIFGAPIGAPAPTDFYAKGPVSASSVEITDARLSLAAFDRAMMTNQERDAFKATSPMTEKEEDAKKIAARHVAALQAHPALRKFVRLIVDIPIPLDAVPAKLRSAGRGVVSVIVQGPSTATRQSATAFLLRIDTNVESSVFEPCPEAQFGGEQNPSLVPSLPLDTGVVALNIARNGEAAGERRFRIEVIDAIAGLISLRRGIQSTVYASRMGLSTSHSSSGEAGLRTRGLMLLDTEANVPVVIAQQRAVRTPMGAGEITLFYAESLVDGYRPDVVRPDGAVFPIAARKLRYDVITNAFTALKLPEDSYRDTEHRDEGYVLPGARVHTTSEAGRRPEKRLATSEQLLCWTGNNLGMPTPWQLGSNELMPPPPDQLPVQISYDFKPGYLGPILRVRGRYRYMLRARKINGSSVPISISQALAGKHALGDPFGSDYVYVPVERTPAPTILVPHDQRLTAPENDSDQPSSQIVLVNQDEVAVRMLVAPRIAFDLAEQQGQFDVSPLPGESAANAQARALARKTSGTYQRLRRNDEGGYPVRNTGVAAPDARYEGALLFELLARPNTAPKTPYYVDSSVCFLGSNLTATKATPPFSIAEASAADEVSFWRRSAVDKAKRGQGFAPEKIRPIKLEVVAVRSGKSRVVNGGEQQFENNGQTINVSVLRVEVAPGDTLSLDVWLNRTAEIALAQSLIHNSLKRLARRLELDRIDSSKALAGADSPDMKTREDWWFEQTSRTRISALHEVATFRIEHVVPIPLQPPRALRPIGCTRANDIKQWDKLAKDPNAADQCDAETTFVWGTIVIDRKTTGRVWAEAIWREVDPVLARRRIGKSEDAMEIDQEGLWSYEPGIGQGRLFDIPYVPALAVRPGETEQAYFDRANTISLADDENGEHRNLTADFKSDKARRVLVRLLAQSRFAPPSSDPDDPANTNSSATREDFLAALNGGPRPTGVEEIWLPATRPPAPPKLSKDQGTLYRRRFDPLTSALLPGHRGKSLTHIYRCWLDSDWFSSGEGEKLAIVCRDPSQGRQPEWLLSRLSRWGGDMTMRPSIALEPAPSTFGDPTFLDPRQIVGMTPAVGEIAATTKVAGTPELVDSRGVALALLEPKFHTGVGRWYCDIELLPVAAFRVSLRLSLARYQANAIDGCKLSETVRADAFLLYQPWTFSAARIGSIIEIIATGPAYTQRAPMTRGLNNWERLRDVEARAAEPLIVVELERLGDNGDRPLPVMDAHGNRVATSSRQAIKKEQGWPEALGEIAQGWTRWTMQVAVPPEEVEPRHAVRISLASAHANSEADGTDAVDGPLIYLPEPLVVQLEV